MDEATIELIKGGYAFFAFLTWAGGAVTRQKDGVPWPWQRWVKVYLVALAWPIGVPIVVGRVMWDYRGDD